MNNYRKHFSKWIQWMDQLLNFHIYYYYSNYAKNYYFYHSCQRILDSVWLVFDMHSSIQYCNVAIQIRFRIKPLKSIWIFNRNTFAIRSYSFHISAIFVFGSSVPYLQSIAIRLRFFLFWIFIVTLLICNYYYYLNNGFDLFFISTVFGVHCACAVFFHRGLS